VNAIPTIDQPVNQGLVVSEGAKVVTLTGIGYGVDVLAQNITSVTATSGNTAVANVSILSTTGSTADLRISPVGIGTSTITVTVKDDGGVVGGGIDTKTITFPVNIIVTELNELKKAVISLYPNPANDYVVVGLDNVTAERVVITDLSGRIVLQETVATGSEKVQLSISNLPKGLYFVTVKAKEHSQTLKFFRQ